MKANEAPEKIYVKITHPISDEYTEMIAFKDGDGIEYIRADVFIEKAFEFFENELCCYVKAQDFVIEQSRLENDFKNYMKGE